MKFSAQPFIPKINGLLPICTESLTFQAIGAYRHHSPSVPVGEDYPLIQKETHNALLQIDLHKMSTQNICMVYM